MEHVPRYSIFLSFGTSRVGNLLAAFTQEASYYSRKNTAGTFCAINKYPFHQESNSYHRGGKKEKIWLFTCCEMDLQHCFLHQVVGLSHVPQAWSLLLQTVHDFQI